MLGHTVQVSNSIEVQLESGLDLEVVTDVSLQIYTNPDHFSRLLCGRAQGAVWCGAVKATGLPYSEKRVSIRSRCGGLQPWQKRRPVDSRVNSDCLVEAPLFLLLLRCRLGIDCCVLTQEKTNEALRKASNGRVRRSSRLALTGQVRTTGLKCSYVQSFSRGRPRRRRW